LGLDVPAGFGDPETRLYLLLARRRRRCARAVQRTGAPSRQLRARPRMRELVDADRVQRFMRAAGGAAAAEGVCYLNGGATAVLLGWRGATVDIDVKLDPEDDTLMRALPAIKNE